MKEFIENNKRWFKFYSKAARLIGYGVLVLAVLIIYQELSKDCFRNAAYYYGLINALQRLLFDYLLVVLFAIMLSQLLRYIAEPKYECGWLLRNGDKLIYCYAGVLVLAAAWKHFYWLVIMDAGYDGSWLLYVVIAMLYELVKVVILVGLGQILKRVLPVIEEHKGLV